MTGLHGSKWCESYIVNHLCKKSRPNILPFTNISERPQLSITSSTSFGTS